MSDRKRKYQKKERAEAEARTRSRITESAVELHGSLGPARTSMTAVAEHAGVRRSTLYRHFPDERALFGACSAHWAEANPPPDIGAWNGIGDPGDRLDSALAELYAYYRRTEGMLDKLLRDEASVPVVAELMGAFHALLAEATDVLMRGRGLRGAARDRTRAAIGHALAFPTWRDLTMAQGLGDAEAADLMRRLVAAAA
jgi:AcrR family transcriptional regulator